jgi:hypothetical protein
MSTETGPVGSVVTLGVEDDETDGEYELHIGQGVAQPISENGSELSFQINSSMTSGEVRLVAAGSEAIYAYPFIITRHVQLSLNAFEELSNAGDPVYTDSMGRISEVDLGQAESGSSC